MRTLRGDHGFLTNDAGCRYFFHFDDVRVADLPLEPGTRVTFEPSQALPPDARRSPRAYVICRA